VQSSAAPPRLLVVASPGTEGTVADVLRRVHDAGVELVFAEGRRGHRIPDALLELPRVTVAGVPLEREGKEAKTVRIFRHAANVVRFLDPKMEGGSWTRDALMKTVLERIKYPDPEAPIKPDLPEPVWHTLTTFTRNLERMLPPHPELEQAIRELRPAAVLLLSRIGKNSVELDVLKVARLLRLPSILLVWSWDNLTSKAVLNEHPDHLLVWNDEMAREANAYHGVPRERIHIVGSPLFDRFFELARAVPDVQPAEPGLLYLGSSPYASDDESAICDEWIAAIRNSPDPLLAGVRIAIRPHPADHSWDGWRPPDDRVALSTSHKSEPERLLALVRDASVVVGLNTSAEIEAAVAGRPVATFRAGSRADGQEGALHFRYLLEANGGFVVDAPDLDAHVTVLSRLLQSEWNADATARFLERFLRPAGLNEPVCPIVAEKIIKLVPPLSARAADRADDRQLVG
jgi:hypothetical protein